jgi:hypothetical protein
MTKNREEVAFNSKGSDEWLDGSVVIAPLRVIATG